MPVLELTPSWLDAPPMRLLPLAGRDAADRDSLTPFEADLVRLYRDEFDRLYRYLDRQSGDAALAVDLAQEAFVRLLRRGTLPDEPSGWLVAVATNLLRDHQRQRGRRLALVTAFMGDTAASEPASPAVAVEQHELRAQVRQALDQLPARDCQALLMRHGGYSYREIAVAIAVADTSVGSILLRAGRQFRRAYEALHGSPG